MGLDNAGRAARRLVEAGAHGLVSWGCAAALSPKLKTGDLCLPARVVDGRARQWPAAAAWHRRARHALEDTGEVCTEPLFSADRPAASTADKHDLAAASGAVAVDMESAAVASVASEFGLPFIAVRAIADPADMPLPAAVIRAADATGAVRRSALLVDLLSHPGEIASVVRLAWQFRAALRTLTRAAARLDDRMLLAANGI
jgi:adenosylhomocysteine nucleosidase